MTNHLKKLVAIAHFAITFESMLACHDPERFLSIFVVNELGIVRVPLPRDQKVHMTLPTDSRSPLETTRMLLPVMSRAWSR